MIREDPIKVNRNLSFKSDIIELSGQVEFNFLPYETGNSLYKIWRKAQTDSLYNDNGAEVKAFFKSIGLEDDELDSLERE